MLLFLRVVSAVLTLLFAGFIISGWLAGSDFRGLFVLIASIACSFFIWATNYSSLQKDRKIWKNAEEEEE